MDYFAHGLWSYIIFHKTKKPIYAVLFGLLPDTFSWAIFLFYRIFTDGVQPGPPRVSQIPAWVFSLYGLTHSLVIFGIVILVIYLLFNKIPVYMYAWAIHILIDIPTHTREFLPTPFLWPVSNWYFPGIRWASLWFMIINYAAITGCIIFIIWKRKVHART